MTQTQQRAMLVEEEVHQQTDSGTPTATQASTTFLDRWLERASMLPPIVAAVIALAYVAGYVIDGVYLNIVGVRPPDLIASRYLATGVLYLTMTFWPLAIGAAGFWLARALPENWKKWQEVLARIGKGVMVIILLATYLYSLAGTLTGADPNSVVNGINPQRFWLALFASLINTVLWSAIIILIWSAARPDERPGIRWWSAWYGPAGSLTVIPIVFIVTLGIFAGLVYPQIRTGYGGGAPIQVQLILDKGSVMTRILPMCDDEKTDPVTLLDQNDEGYVVSLNDGHETVVVPRDAVNGVIGTPIVVLSH